MDLRKITFLFDRNARQNRERNLSKYWSKYSAHVNFKININILFDEKYNSSYPRKFQISSYTTRAGLYGRFYPLQEISKV